MIVTCIASIVMNFAVVMNFAIAMTQDGNGGGTLVGDVVYCGNPIGTNVNIANQPIVGKEYGIPFVARTSGPVKNVYWWARNSGDEPSGYSKGSGGDIRITIHKDRLGAPANDYLGKCVVDRFELNRRGNRHNQLRVTDLASAEVSVVKGNRYWIVYKNVHANRVKNYISLNGPQLVNGTASYGDWSTHHREADDTRAFHIARPCDDLYLHQRQCTRASSGSEQCGEWTPYRDDNSPSRVTFPMVLLRVDSERDGVVEHGFPFHYGPIWTGYATQPNWLESMPKVGEPHRIRQVVTFQDCDTFPIKKANLKFFARNLDMDKTVEIAVFINGVFQGSANVNKLDWYSVPLGLTIKANTKYEIEFLARENVEAMIMGMPMRRSTSLGYVGKAQLSLNSGKEWTGYYNVGHHKNHQGIQLSFYIESLEY